MTEPRKRPSANTQWGGVRIRTEFLDDGTEWVTEFRNGKKVRTYRVDPSERKPWWKFWKPDRSE